MKKKEKMITEKERGKALKVVSKLYDAGKIQWREFVTVWNLIVGMVYERGV